MWKTSYTISRSRYNINATFGDGGDADIDYDGTNMNINPQVAGAGDLLLTAGALVLPLPSALVIAAGVVTTVRNLSNVDTQDSDPTDDVDTVNPPNTTLPCLLMLTSATDARDPTFKDGGGLRLAGDFTCTDINDEITLVNPQGNATMLELSRSTNG